MFWIRVYILIGKDHSLCILYKEIKKSPRNFFGSSQSRRIKSISAWTVGFPACVVIQGLVMALSYALVFLVVESFISVAHLWGDAESTRLIAVLAAREPVGPGNG